MEIMPELVKSDDEGYLAVSYNELVPVLLEAIREQQDQLKEMSETIALQQRDIEDMKVMLKGLLNGK